MRNPPITIKEIEDMNYLIDRDLVFRIGGTPLLYRECKGEGILFGRYGDTRKTFAIPLNEVLSKGDVWLKALKIDMEEVEVHPKGKKDLAGAIIYKIEDSLLQEAGL